MAKMDLTTSRPVFGVMKTNDAYHSERLDNLEPGFEPEEHGCPVAFFATESEANAKGREWLEEDGPDEGYRAVVFRVMPMHTITLSVAFQQHVVTAPQPEPAAPVNRRSSKKAVPAPSVDKRGGRKLDLSQ